ncbi:hypothetical protein BTI679_48930 [Bacillus wiedmannii]|nr:hypothetical protein BTI679_48930 [Bacillus wiedmannii]
MWIENWLLVDYASLEELGGEGWIFTLKSSYVSNII